VSLEWLFGKKPAKKSSGQVSLEYLILLAAFFGVLGLALPVMSESTQGFLGASDSLLAKRIADEAQEQINLMKFLGNGSARVLEFFPAKKITLYSQGNELIVQANEKQFSVDCFSPQLIPTQEFSSKFFIKIEKKENNVQVFVEGG
jgi:uncharacterized protein (UPF0333 family)